MDGLLEGQLSKQSMGDYFIVFGHYSTSTVVLIFLQSLYTMKAASFYKTRDRKIYCFFFLLRIEYLLADL